MDLTLISGVEQHALLFLFFIAVVAGVLDTLAGGGGLLTLPALLMAGVPPVVALGTNKLQGTAGTATATLTLLFKQQTGQKLLNKRILPPMIFAFIGAVLGALCVQVVSKDALSFVIPIVLLCIAVYFLVGMKPRAGCIIKQWMYDGFVMPCIGFYDGMFGPGTGSFFAMAGVSCRGLNLILATACAKALNLATNMASLCVFIYLGKVAWVVGLVMMLGQFLGASIGVRLLYKVQTTHLRWLIVSMSTLMLIKYIMSAT